MEGLEMELKEIKRIINKEGNISYYDITFQGVFHNITYNFLSTEIKHTLEEVILLNKLIDLYDNN
jgi:hypothetical protein